MTAPYTGEPAVMYIFFRDGMFYPLALYDDDDAVENAKCNPGTLRVEDMGGKIVWEAMKQ